MQAELERRVWQLEQRANEAFTKVDSMDHLLNGNGKPGFISDTNESLSEIKEYINKQKGMWAVILALALLITICVGILTVRDLMRKADNAVPFMPTSDVHLPQNASEADTWTEAMR